MYEDFYGLQARPFALSPDPRFFYGSKGHRRAMAYLEYGVQLEEGFIVITGEVGAGKTTLVRNLFQSLSGKPLVAAQLVSTQLDADNLLRSVCLAYGLEDAPADKAGQLRRLEQFLLRTRARGQRALLVVDEAQNLGNDAVEELRMLSNFQGEDGPLLQSFLLGQPEFRGILRSENMQQLRQRVIATYHLGPMDEVDTRAYVEHRLAQVGWTDNPRFEEAIWPLIHHYSGGIPRRVNTFCDRLFLMGFLEERHTLGPEQAETVINELEDDLGGGTAPAPAPKNRNGQDAGGLNGLELPGLDDADEALYQMDKRLHRIERYLVYNFKLTRQILAAMREAPNHNPDEQHHDD
ncbi:XrtA/PEP-CTERM system-associated ATPase [Alkalilimnicola ehrlichii MLHE-1]|uniref:AAA ATPase n=1 Tax=Alkalilimnicola ehrlichii (strain ATCC BAA-1101 / DSM 17681 / MLHE-1) TaxID=187272 RepID=Q0ACD8_ALKEH|nr:XrtA/PEP-CTERM system-associated ATPase [Alkalilimnicola ehrlichii]ABI55499.1 AAA ATPase [Alkalilimnicola ehrlichii MLHE-1]